LHFLSYRVCPIYGFYWVGGLGSTVIFVVGQNLSATYTVNPFGCRASSFAMLAAHTCGIVALMWLAHRVRMAANV
jgi:hypothetical protein